MAKLYKENSIESLSPLEFTRKRPGVYCGSTEYSSQLLIELLHNAVDEFNIGNATQIDINIDKNKMFIEDNGQGFFTNSMREDGKTVLEASFSVLNTSGKFHDDGTYEGTSAGLNGIGSKLATYLSHNLKVTTYRDNKYETCYFTEGVFEKREVGDLTHHSGTVVEYYPSEEFFTNIDIEKNRIIDLLQTTACLCPGLTINFNYNGEQNTYHSTKGLNELADKDIGQKELLKKRLNIQAADGKYKLDLVMTFTSDFSSRIIPYVNTGLTERGVHLTKMKTIITRELNNFYKEQNWLQSEDSNFSGEEIQEGMYLIFNMKAPGVAYDAQTKGNVVKLDAQPLYDIFTEKLRAWLRLNSKDLKVIADKAIGARKAAEAARKARDAVRDSGINKEKKKNVDLPSKLADCWSKDRKNCELFVVEGDSAAGGLKLARDKEYVAVLPVRGKILNVQKASIDKVVANAEIVDMINAFGLELDVDTNKLIFNKNKLRYGKIIISADADDDGSHIQMLFYTFIWNYCPELFNQGYIYATIPPLYKITDNKNNYTYILNDEKLKEYKETHTGKYIVNRMKGLGECDPEELHEFLLNPETRVLKQITIQDMQQMGQKFEDLMGKSSEPRKQLLAEKGYLAKEVI